MAIEQEEKVQTQGSATQRRYRTLAVVKQEAITRVEKPLEDSVFVWPHLLVRRVLRGNSCNGDGNLALVGNRCAVAGPCDAKRHAKPGQSSLVLPGFAGTATLL